MLLSRPYVGFFALSISSKVGSNHLSSCRRALSFYVGRVCALGVFSFPFQSGPAYDYKMASSFHSSTSPRPSDNRCRPLTEQERYADQLLSDFSERTGLISAARPAKRYLWTDSYAVCTYIGLYKRSGQEKYLESARNLVDQVHLVLSRHRIDDDERTGWISGLTEDEGKLHPTIGGLRIGKEKNERKLHEPVNERDEWHQDGQYFHYLTKWMKSLQILSRVTGDKKYLKWAMDLAKKADEAFVYGYKGSWGPHQGKKRMYWKMSIDLTRPLVKSMGQHDPLDGFVTVKLLMDKSRSKSSEMPSPMQMEHAVKDFTDMVAPMQSFVTTDALGIGGLLVDAYTLLQVMLEEDAHHSENWMLKHVVKKILKSAHTSLGMYGSMGELSYDAESRLAFRELGLSIGIHALEDIGSLLKDRTWADSDFHREVEQLTFDLSRYIPMADHIESFWMIDGHQKTTTWKDHQDINSVMLAASLVPDGCICIS